MIWSRRSCCMKIIGHCWQPEEIRRENCTQQLDNKPKQVGKRTPRWYCNCEAALQVSFCWYGKWTEVQNDIMIYMLWYAYSWKLGKTWKHEPSHVSKGGHTTDAMPAMLMRWFDLIMRYTFCDIQCKVCRSDGPAGLSWKILKDLKSLCASVSHQGI